MNHDKNVTTTVGHLIDGKIVADTERTQPVFNPATGQSTTSVALASKATVEAAIASAEVGVGATLSFGAAGYPNDAERFDGLCARALERLRDERAGLAPALSIDEDTLAKVAKITGGEYFRAQDAKQLVAVLSDLPSNIVVQRRNIEITAWFVLPGTLLVLIGVALSVWWNRSPALGMR